jgi:hypothetical protein
MADNWINVNDFDPTFVRQWVKSDLNDHPAEFWFS